MGWRDCCCHIKRLISVIGQFFDLDETPLRRGKTSCTVLLQRLSANAYPGSPIDVGGVGV